MTSLGAAVNGLFDLLIAPLAGMPAVAMVLVSVLTAVWALLLFKAATSADRLSATRRLLTGHLLEQGLYQDHLGVLLKIQRDLAVANLKYVSLSFPALLVLMVPMVLTLAQLDARFAHRPLLPGEETVVRVELAPEQASRLAELTLQGSPGIQVEAGPVLDKTSASSWWRVRVGHTGDQSLTVDLPGEGTWIRSVPVGDELSRVSEKQTTGWLAPLLRPGVDPLPGGQAIQAIIVQLPDRHVRYWGIELSWLVAFMILSLAAGFALKDWLRVTL